MSQLGVKWALTKGFTCFLPCRFCADLSYQPCRWGGVHIARESCTLLYRDLTTFAALPIIANLVSLFVEALSVVICFSLSSFILVYLYYSFDSSRSCFLVPYDAFKPAELLKQSFYFLFDILCLESIKLPRVFSSFLSMPLSAR